MNSPSEMVISRNNPPNRNMLVKATCQRGVWEQAPILLQTDKRIEAGKPWRSWSTRPPYRRWKP